MGFSLSTGKSLITKIRAPLKNPEECEHSFQWRTLQPNEMDRFYHSKPDQTLTSHVNCHLTSQLSCSPVPPKMMLTETYILETCHYQKLATKVSRLTLDDHVYSMGFISFLNKPYTWASSRNHYEADEIGLWLPPPNGGSTEANTTSQKQPSNWHHAIKTHKQLVERTHAVPPN